MLRPSNSLLGSSRAARNRSIRAERAKALGGIVRGISGLSGGLVGTAWDLALLAVIPLAYLSAAYLTLDLPLRWMFAGAKFEWAGLGVWLVAFTVSIVGIVRAMQEAQPALPVRPVFARRLLALAWVAALLMAIADCLS
jgi:hypothetical protein